MLSLIGMVFTYLAFGIVSVVAFIIAVVLATLGGLVAFFIMMLTLEIVLG